MSKKNEIVKNKKINKSILTAVAVVLVLAIVATAVVVAIRNDRELYVDQDGIEHWLVTDENGNTTIGPNGDLVVYATDLDGKIIKDDDGNPEYRYVAFPEILIKDSTLETPDYKITLSEEWTISENGTFHYQGNEDIELTIDNFGAYDGTVSEYLAEDAEEYEEIMAMWNTLYEDFTETEGTAKITLKDIECITREYTGKKDGKDDLYSKSLYFIYNGDIFKACFTCWNGSYDGTIDVESLLDSNLVMKTITLDY